MDFIAYLLFYCVEIKDKPRKYSTLLFTSCNHSIVQRTTWRLSCYIVYSSDSICRTSFWLSIESSNWDSIAHQVGSSRYCGRVCDSCVYIVFKYVENQINPTIIQAIYAIVATTSGSLSSLYPALIIALSNAAPSFTNIGVTASARLIQLFTSFSNPLFLLSDEGHPRLLFFM